VQQAYDVLSDDKKRKLYDQFGPGFEQMAQQGGAQWSSQVPPEFQHFDFSQMFGGGGGGRRASGGQVPPELEEMLRQFTSGGGEGFDFGGTRRRRRQPASPGADLQSELRIPFRTAVEGGTMSLRVRRHGGKAETIDVKIPAGIEDGKTIRLRGQGDPSPNDGPPGDLLITVRIDPHPNFRRDGLDLIVRVPVTLAEAALGAKVDVPAPQGEISLKVPAGTSSGTRLRAKGQGIRKPDGSSGDLYAEIMIAIPRSLDAASEKLVRDLSSRIDFDPRAELRW
jgi:DnaJ-class molecular chaperone